MVLVNNEFLHELRKIGEQILDESFSFQIEALRCVSIFFEMQAFDEFDLVWTQFFQVNIRYFCNHAIASKFTIICFANGLIDLYSLPTV
jgi:hypothetical protein